MLNIGIVGKGYFGSKIYNTLKDKHNIVFYTGKEFNVSFDIDWVIVATTTSTHYEICKTFLEKGVNVFVEKPITASYKKAKKLIDLANSNNVKLYIDDIFLYHPTFKIIKEQDYKNIEFSWNKLGSFKDNIYNNLAYHDIYMALSLGVDLSEDAFFLQNQVNKKRFNIGNATFEYDRLSNHKSKYVLLDGHKIEFKTSVNLLDIMFDCVFNENASFKNNNRLALKTISILGRLEKNKPKVAVVGAGIFGITAALKLQDDYDVFLFEKNEDIIQNASAINQYRLHRGYHYPRSIETAMSSKQGEKSFLKEYDCQIKDTEQYYAIAYRSKVSTEQYETFLEKVELEYEKLKSDLVTGNVLGLYKVNETLFDPHKLHKICRVKLDKSTVKLRFSEEFDKKQVDNFDYVINATYSNLNAIVENKKHYQFELCEKPIIKLPKKFHKKGIIVMDGPFTCIDPYSDTDYHVIGNVVHAIHHTNIGEFPEIPEAYKKLLNKGLVKNPKITKWDKFLETANTFFNEIDGIEHIGSMFTIRCVLPNRDFDDARPTLIEKQNDKVFSLFSGKITTAVDCSEELISVLNSN